jgi:HK97 family phage portal protein
MGWWSRIANYAIRRSGEADTGLWSGGTTDWGENGTGIPVTSVTAMQHTAVMACVSILAGDVAKIPLDLFRRLPNGGKEAARGHWLRPLLRDPNNWQTALEFKEMMQASLLLRGNAYAVAVRHLTGPKSGIPRYLVPIHPDRCIIWEAPSGEWFYVVTRNGLHEMAVLREMPWFISSEDVLHIKWLSSWNSLLGSNRIAMMRESVGLSMALEQHQARFAGQGARSGGILTTEQKLIKEVREQLAADWKKQRAGPRNSGNTTILEQGLKWQPLGLSMVDSQFIESRGFQLRDICRAFDVPPYKLAIEGENEGPAMVQMGQEYLNGPVSGHCERWKAKCENFFGIDGEDLFLEWNYEHFLKADLMSRYTARRQAVGSSWMSANEARRGEGLPDVPNGDTVLQPANMIALGSKPIGVTGGPGSDMTGVPAPGGDGDPLRDPTTDVAPGS